MLIKRGDIRGQVTIFIIVAIIIVAAVGIFFLIRNQTASNRIPSELEPVYDDFLTCIQDKVFLGVRTLEAQGGYISLPDFVSGSEYMPFSSQLSFLGNPIPYWYYVSGNNLEREQVPSKNMMESDLSSFIESSALGCVPEGLEEGLEIEAGENLDAQTSIKSGEVQVNLDLDLSISKGENSVSIKNHKIILDSELGKLYDNALIVYNTEQKELFLENYGVDVLRLYSPVDGVDFQCSPQVWSADNVFEELKDAIEDNVASIKTQGNKDDYFLVDSLSSGISNGFYAKFLNSKGWSNSYEVNPSDGPLLVANPVGAQQGLGVLGFCYVPYHFVYNVNYPVLVQVYSENTDEFFQFPVAVVLQGNKPRDSLAGIASAYEGPEICENRNTRIELRTFDSNSNLVDSEIYFECFGDSCMIGESENGVLDELFPQCVNGYIIAKADGYEDAELQLQGIDSGSISLVLDKLYEKEIQLNLDSKIYTGEATITFERGGKSQTLIYPLQDKINLSRGDYDISVYIYENSSLNLGASVQEYCTEVPRTFGGVFGLTKKECFEVEIPEQLITSALAGGGTSVYSVTESQLRTGSQLLISAEKLPEPGSLNQLQENYVLFDSKGLEVFLR